MKPAIIAPVKHLEELDGSSEVHLALPYLCHKQAYAEWMLNQRGKGHYVILDNGAYVTDGGESWDMGSVLEVAARIQPSEVVVPDAIHDMEKTIVLAEGAVRSLTTPRGRRLWEQAGSPRFMVVPQGDDLDSWTFCLGYLLGAMRKVVDRAQLPLPTIGVSKVYGSGILDRLRVLRATGNLGRAYGSAWLNYHVHLLGWADKESTLRTAVASFPEVRSTDSARPINYAIDDLVMGTTDVLHHASRREDYFDLELTPHQLDVAKVNIEHYRNICRGR